MSKNDIYLPSDFGKKEEAMMAKYELQLQDSKNYFLSCIMSRLDRSYKLYSSYNGDRKVIKKLFTSLKDRFSDRNGGYTRIIKKDDFRKGDGTQKCIIEYLQ